MIFKSVDDDGGFPESVVNNIRYSEDRIREYKRANMKKKNYFGSVSALAVGAALALSVVGCDSDKVDRQAAEKLMNQQEIQVIDGYRQAIRGRNQYPRNVITELRAFAKTRTEVPTSGFFCDGQDLVRGLDWRIAEWNKSRDETWHLSSMSDYYRAIYKQGMCGEDVQPALDVDAVDAPTKPVTPPDFQEVQPVVRGNKLTPEMYDRMIEVADTCQRSKNYMMEATKNKGILTTTEYDGLMDSVLECKRFELEQKLQSVK